MTCYVDIPRWKRGKTPSGHLIADSLEELHALAETVGIDRRKWFQEHAVVPHYTLLEYQRDAAIAAGAVPLSGRDWERAVGRAHAATAVRARPAPRRAVIQAAPTLGCAQGRLL